MANVAANKKLSTMDAQGTDEGTLTDERVTSGAKGGKGEKTPLRVYITVDNSPEEVIRLDQSEDIVVEFDSARFLELDDETLDRLHRTTQRRYFEARGAAQARKEASVRDREAFDFTDALVSPITGMAGDRIQKMLRPRRGWHQTVVGSSGGEVDDYKSRGYVFIREAKGSEKPGEESGDIVKLRESGGMGSNVETNYLYAMEIPEDLYKRHITAMALKSRTKFKSHRDAMEMMTEEVNRGYGRKKDVVKLEDFSEEKAERFTRGEASE